MKYLLIAALLSLSWCGGAARAALAQPDLLVQAHFAGAQKIAADPHAAAFAYEFSSPDALALREQTAAKLSRWLAGWLPSQLKTAPIPGGASKLRPLFDDLQASEFFLEMRAAANGQVEVALAIQLDGARAQVWQTGLKAFFATATFKSSGGWLIFDSNPALLGLGDRLAQRIATPATDWFAADVNWPRLAQWHPLLKELALPETQFTVTAPADYFNVSGKFTFPQNLALNLEPWRMPTNTIHVPFDSFTAARGFASWWQSQSWAQPYQISPVPNQVFFWALPAMPFRTFASVPVPNAAAALSQAYERLSPMLAAANAAGTLGLNITPEMSGNEISFGGLVYGALRLQALTEPAGQFFYSELAPNTAKSKALPRELYQRLATKDLVFYHYEAPGSRLLELTELTQFGLVMTGHKQLPAESAAFKWVQSTATNLVVAPPRDHTDTEITQSGPAELTFARKSPCLFTGLEMYALANWLEAPNFPGFDIKLPPRRVHPQGGQLQSVPATGAPSGK